MWVRVRRAFSIIDNNAAGKTTGIRAILTSRFHSGLAGAIIGEPPPARR
jgi:ABC-type uncharacterized transport system ATPase subunit